MADALGTKRRLHETRLKGILALELGACREAVRHIPDRVGRIRRDHLKHLAVKRGLPTATSFR